MFRFLLIALLALGPLAAGEKEKKLTPEERVDILRGLMAEYANAKTFLPRSKKPLQVNADGTWDKKAWDQMGKEQGPAARSGDMVQVTKVTIDEDRIHLEINNGVKSGRKWYDRVEVGMGNSTSPIGRNDTVATAGTNLVLVYPDKLHNIRTADVKKALAPVLDFDRHSVTENYVEKLPEPVQAAIKEKRAIEGMDQDQVLLAMGRPVRKERKTIDGVDTEDWMYGQAPGKITFVTFSGSKVSKVKEAYAGLGGSTAPTLPVQ
jgi:hypothetical protein